MNKLLNVGIGEAMIAFTPDVLVSYALGSCVGVCLYDYHKHMAGMVHILLPKNLNKQSSNEYKFADSGIQRLMNDMLQRGANRKHIIAKLAGGAEMFPTYIEASSGIGYKNVEAAIHVLKSEGVPIIAQDTGENFGRSIWFHPKDGTLKVKTIKHGTYVI